jgi:hypothetical protein
MRRRRRTKMQADHKAFAMLPVIQELQQQGLSLKGIAARLNEMVTKPQEVVPGQQRL